MSGKSRGKIPQHSHQNQIVRQSIETRWNYPAPPPHLLNQYKEIDPRFADQFLLSWQSESAHRQQMEKSMIENESKKIAIHEYDVKVSHRTDTIALVLSFIIILICVGIAFYGIYLSQPIAAISGFVAALALFWTRSKSK
jgi:uncharacterized membrane protein